MLLMQPPNCGDELRRLADNFERKWLHKVPTTHRWKWHIGRALLPWAARMRVRREVGLRGEAVRRTAGVSLSEQYRWALATEQRQGLRADFFYRLRLYEPDRHSRKEEFLSDRQCCHLTCGLLDLCPTSQVTLHSDKRVFARHCAAHGLPTPQPVWDSGVVHPKRLPDRDLFAKQVGNTSAGAGAHRWTCCGPDRYRNATGRETDGASVIAHLQSLATEGSSWLLQPALENHESIARLTNGALATFRIVTSRVGRHGVEWVGAVLRIPTGKNAVDNYCQGNLVVSVDAASGHLDSPGFRSHALLGSERVEVHPDTGERFEGHTIGDWSALRDLVNRTHETCPDLPFVGWDVALCPEGPVLIEANIGWGAQVMQVPSTRGICDTLFGARYLEAYYAATGVAPSTQVIITN